MSTREIKEPNIVTDRDRPKATASKRRDNKNIWDIIKDLPAFILAILTLIAVLFGSVTAAYAYFAKKQELYVVDCFAQKTRAFASEVDKQSNEQLELSTKKLELNILLTKQELLNELNPAKSSSFSTKRSLVNRWASVS